MRERRNEADVEATLLARAAEAVDQATELRAESETVAAPDSRGLTTRCAWCGRYWIRDRWVVVESLPPGVSVTSETTTHGICPACVDILRQSRMSI